MKKLTVILLTVMLVASLFVSCENNATPKNIEETVSVNFEGSRTRNLTAELEEFKKDELYWKYTAVKDSSDTTGLNSGETGSGEKNAEAVKDSGTGLGSVGGFSQGKWIFTLYGYKDQSFSQLAYQGETSASLKKDADNSVTVMVSPVKTEETKGTLKISESVSLTKYDSSASATTISVAKVYSVVKVGETAEQALTKTEDEYKVYSLDPGAYKVTVTFADSTYTYASGSVVAAVYSNLETTVTGTLPELVTKVTFDSEINPDIMNTIATSSTVEYSSLGDTMTLSDKKTDSDTAKVEATVSKTTVEDIVKSVIGESNTSGSSVSLAISVDTTAATSSSLELEIGMSATITDSSGVVTTKAVEKLTEYSTVTVSLQKGLSSVVVKHDGNAMTSMESVDGTPASECGGYYYDSTSGVLTIKTKSFSPFAVTYTAPVYEASIESKNYASLDDALASVENNGTVKLKTNVTSEGLTLKKGLTLDLNGYTLTFSDGKNLLIEPDTTNRSESIEVKIKNGKIDGGSGNCSVIKVCSYVDLTLEDVDISADKDDFANALVLLYIGANPAKLTIQNGCNLSMRGAYGVSTNARIGDAEVEIAVKDSTITSSRTNGDSCGMMVNVPAKVTIENSTILGEKIGVLLRGISSGENHTASIENSTIKATGSGSYDTYTDSEWGTGTWTPAAAIVVGNRYANGYKNGTTVSFGDNVTLDHASESAVDICIYQNDEKNPVTVEGFNENWTTNGAMNDATVKSSESNIIYVSDTSSLASAVSNADWTVKLLNDVTLTKNIALKSSITLDMNGKTIGTSGKSEMKVEKGAVLTVKNSPSGQSSDFISAVVKIGASESADGTYFPATQEIVSKVEKNDTIVMGSIPTYAATTTHPVGSGVEWRVLDVDKEGNKVLVISQNVLPLPANVTHTTKVNDAAPAYSWSESGIKTWLNSSEQTSGTEGFKYLYGLTNIGIEKVTLETEQFSAYEKYERTENEEIYLLSWSEAVVADGIKEMKDSTGKWSVVEKSGYFEDNDEVLTYDLAGNLAEWWLRSPHMHSGFDYNEYAAYVELNHNAYGYYCNVAAYEYAYRIGNGGKRGIRPAFWLSGPEN